MVSLSIPVLVMAIINLVIAIHYLWYALFRFKELVFLFFSMAALSVSIYNVFTFFLYNAETFATGIFYQRLQLSSINLVVISFSWFILSWLEIRNKTFQWAISALLILSGLVSIFVHNPFTLSIESISPKFLSFFGYGNHTVFEANEGPFYLIQFSIYMYAAVFLSIKLVKKIISSVIIELRIFKVYFPLFLLMAINDILVGMNVYSFFYLFEYALTLLIINFHFLIQKRFMEAYDASENFKETLEAKYEKKTKELTDAMEELEIINERLIALNLERERQQRIADLDMLMAKNIQRQFLPEKVPDDVNWDIAVYYKPVSGVSGDIYDFYQWDGNLHGISLFDVSGHGISSALITILAKSVVFRNFTEHSQESLDLVMRAINHDLSNELKNIENYLSGILLRIQGDRIEYVNAGHPDLLIKLNGADKVQSPFGEEEDFGYLLGVGFQDSKFRVKEINFSHNDFLILFTDGLCESSNKKGEMFDQTRLSELMEDVPMHSAHQILDYVLQGYLEFLDGKRAEDDITMVIVRHR